MNPEQNLPDAWDRQITGWEKPGRVPTVAPPLFSCVSLGKLICFSELPYLQVQNGSLIPP